MKNSVQNEVISQYKKSNNTAPLMIFSPGRLNMIGEHTDYNEGFVFPAAIDKGIYAAFGTSNDDQCHITALDMDETYSFSLDQIEAHENGGWRNYILGVLHGIQQAGKHLQPFQLVFSGDIPDGAGLSSSAALENAIVFGLNELFDLSLSKEEMIFISQKAEHDFVGVKCGIMDQYASMFGQKNKGLLLDCRSISATPFEIDLNNYQILLINSNVKHSLADSAYNKRRAVCEKTSELLKIRALRDATESGLQQLIHELSEEEYQMALYVVQENKRTAEAGKAMQAGDIDRLGNLLYASHQGLSSQYKVSCDELDFLVDYTKTNQAIAGARMMGGGFGGCTINIIKKNNVERFSKEISAAYMNQFNNACSIYEVSLSDGTHVIEKF